MNFHDVKKLDDDQLEVEIDIREKMMKEKLVGEPTLNQVHSYHLLLLMYNEANERKWQREHSAKQGIEQ